VLASRDGPATHNSELDRLKLNGPTERSPEPIGEHFRPTSMTATTRPLRSAVVVGFVLLAAALGGCAASSSGGAAGGSSNPTPSPSATTSGSTSAGLRGVRVAKVTCSLFELQPRGTAEALPVSPERLVLCPVPQPSDAVQAPTELAPVPPPLLAAFATPDVPVAGSGTVCAAYADAPQAAFAVLPGGAVYRLRIPQDACQHYLPAVLLAMQHYRPATPTG